MAHHSTNDLSATRGELAKLEERHEKFKVDYYNPINSLRKANNLAITRQRQLREKRDEQMVTQVEIACLRGQLTQALDIRDHAFAFGTVPKS